MYPTSKCRMYLVCPMCLEPFRSLQVHYLSTWRDFTTLLDYSMCLHYLTDCICLTSLHYLSTWRNFTTLLDYSTWLHDLTDCITCHCITWLHYITLLQYATSLQYVTSLHYVASQHDLTALRDLTAWPHCITWLTAVRIRAAWRDCSTLLDGLVGAAALDYLTTLPGFTTLLDNFT